MTTFRAFWANQLLLLVSIEKWIFIWFRINEGKEDGRRNILLWGWIYSLRRASVFSLMLYFPFCIPWLGRLGICFASFTSQEDVCLFILFLWSVFLCLPIAIFIARIRGAFTMGFCELLFSSSMIWVYCCNFFFQGMMKYGTLVSRFWCTSTQINLIGIDCYSIGNGAYALLSHR